VGPVHPGRRRSDRARRPVEVGRRHAAPRPCCRAWRAPWPGSRPGKRAREALTLPNPRRSALPGCGYGSRAAARGWPWRGSRASLAWIGRAPRRFNPFAIGVVLH
jgi:hypothetical protein